MFRGGAPARPHDGLLHDMGDQSAVVAPYVGEGEAAAVARGGTALGEQHPLVGAERTVVPDRVVERGEEDRRGLLAQHPGLFDRQCGGRSEEEIGGVRESGAVQHRVVRQRLVGADPQPLFRGPRRVRLGRVRYVPHVEDPAELGRFAVLGVVAGPELVQIRERPRGGRRRHRRLPVAALFRLLEGGGEREDDVRSLPGRHPARHIRSAVAHALHGVLDGPRRVAGPQEVAVQ